MVKRFEIKGYKITVFDRRKEIGCGSNNGRFENQFFERQDSIVQPGAYRF